MPLPQLELYHSCLNIGVSRGAHGVERKGMVSIKAGKKQQSARWFSMTTGKGEEGVL